MENWNKKLIAAVQEGTVENLKICLYNGADIEYRHASRRTALIWAAWYGHLEITRVLLDRGCKKEAKDAVERTALLWAAHNGHLDVTRLLLDRGCKIDARGNLHDTALMMAARNEHKEVTCLLLDRGCDIEATMVTGITALMWVVGYGLLNMTQFLIDRGSNKDTTDSDGRTALHLAAEEGHFDVTEYLIGIGSSPWLKTYKGKTPYDLAADMEEQKVVDFLKTVMSNKFPEADSNRLQPQHTLGEEDTVPAEIRLMTDKKSVPLYLKLLESGSEKKRDIRLVIVGKKGTGKTSLVKRLFSEEISKIREVASTNGIDIHKMRCIANSDDGMWNKLDDNNEEIELHTRLLKPYDERLKTQGKDSIDNISKETRFSDSEKCETAFQQPETVQPTKPIDSQIKPPMSIESRDKQQASPLEQTHREIKSMLKSGVDLQNKEEYVTLLLWDFAGDEEFYHTHQTFLSQDSIYLVVTKLDEANDKHAQDMFQLWMSSIHCYCTLEEQKDRPDGNVNEKQDSMIHPPVILVGSHKDRVQVLEGEKIDDSCRNCLDRYVQKVSDDACRHIRYEHFISNTEDENSKFQKIRQDILELARKMRAWNKDYPLKFIQLEKCLKEKKKELQVPIISFPDVQRIATETPMPLNDIELMLYLKFHHEVRALIFFEDLPDFIILDTQWLSDAFKCIVTAKKFQSHVRRHRNKGKWDDLHRRGILHSEVLEDIFKNNPHFYEYKDHILNVMEKFDIVIRPNIAESGDTDDNSCFYVPCIIKEEPELDIYEMFNVTQHTCRMSTWLCFKFRFLPPHLINHLIASLCRSYVVAEVVNSKQRERKLAIFRGKVVVELQKTTKLRKLLVTTGSNLIQVQVLEFGESVTMQRGMYKYIADFIAGEINKIISRRYRMTNVYYEKRWECGHTKPESVTGSDPFSEEQITEYYCGTCARTHKHIGEWSDVQDKTLTLYQRFEDALETDQPTEIANPKIEITNQKTKVRCYLQSDVNLSSMIRQSTNTGSLTGLTKEEFNFTKIGMIVLNILADVLYDLLRPDKSNVPPRSNCDITYMYQEHRKLNKHIPTNRWGWGGSWQDILSTDIAIGDDIERIRLTRNELQHSKAFKLDENRFDELCIIILDILKRFDQHNKPSKLYTDHMNEVLTSKVSAEEVKVVQHQIEKEIKSELVIEVEIEQQLNVSPQ